MAKAAAKVAPKVKMPKASMPKTVNPKTPQVANGLQAYLKASKLV